MGQVINNLVDKKLKDPGVQTLKKDKSEAQVYYDEFSYINAYIFGLLLQVNFAGHCHRQNDTCKLKRENKCLHCTDFTVLSL